MFDVSWSELIVLTGVGIALVGRKDLPRATHFMGTQVGRVVGLLQGARVRADRFTAQNELRQLQNELRSGLRELDAVRTELSVAVSTSGMVGKQLGPTTKTVNRQGQVAATAANHGVVVSGAPTSVSPPTAEAIPPLSSSTLQESTSAIRELAPRQQAVAAVAEEEWTKQGIGFQSRAERGSGDATGSGMLARLLQQSLIYDQHDRVVQEQDEALRSRVEAQQMEKNEKKKS